MTQETKCILSDAEIDPAWGYANFGEGVDKREVILDTLFKIARGYTPCYTAFMICIDLGLIENYRTDLNAVWTQKGVDFVRSYHPHHALVEALKSSRDCVSALHERVRGSIEYGAPAEYFKRDLDKIDQALKQAGAE